VPHAGEINDGSDEFQDLWDAMAIHPDRVAHGTQAVSDQRLARHMRDTGTCCDVAITSNELLAGIAPGEHALPQMVRAGIPCSINTDDSLIFGCDLLSEYEKAHFSLGLSYAELGSCARSSIACSGATPQARESILSEIDAWEKEYREQLGAGFDRRGTGSTPFMSGCIPAETPAVDVFEDMAWSAGSRTGGTVGSNQHGVVGLSKRRGWKRLRAAP